MNKIKSAFNTNYLRGRLQVFIINLLLFVILVVTVVMVFLTKEHIKKNYRYELNNIVKMQHKVIDKWFNERETDINFLATSDIIIHKDLSKIKNLFENFTASQSEFYYINYIDQQGISKVDSTFLAGGTYSKEKFFLDAINGKDGFSRVHMDKTTHTPAIIFSSAVYAQDGEIMGVISGGVRLSSIQSIIEEFHFGSSGETFIINDQKKLITKRRFEQADNVFKTINNTFDSQNFYTNYAGQSVLGAMISSNFGRWFIIAQITEAEIYTLFNQFLFTILVFIIILVLLLIPLIFNFASIIEQPLQHLLHGSRKIKDGNYGYIIKTRHMNYATIELKELSQSFNSMSLELKNIINELTHNSTVDMLSSLLNRREFFNRSEKQFTLCSTTGDAVAILMIDIDFFKKINDSYGHQYGDAAIETVSNIIKTSVSENDIVGRYGGEEFIIFLSKISKQAVYSLAERIRNKISQKTMGNADIIFNCTCSIGVCYYSSVKSTLTLTEIINQADKALYEAKNNGRNQTIIHKKSDV